LEVDLARQIRRLRPLLHHDTRARAVFEAGRSASATSGRGRLRARGAGLADHEGVAPGRLAAATTTRGCGLGESPGRDGAALAVEGTLVAGVDGQGLVVEGDRLVVPLLLQGPVGLAERVVELRRLGRTLLLIGLLRRRLLRPRLGVLDAREQRRPAA